MAEKTAIDELGDLEFLRKMLDRFGGRRATELFGYAVAVGATRKTMPADIVNALVKIGFTRSAVYRALADFRSFAMELEQERGRTMSMSEVLAEINAASVSSRQDIGV